MRIDKLYIKEFKNLKEFHIDLDENQMNTVLLGQNATGKSNFIEAIIKIFKYLDLKKDPPIEPELGYRLEYKITYEIKNYKVIVYFNGKYKFLISENIKQKNEAEEEFNVITKSKFFREKEEYLPKYVFAYYSGISDRLNKLFWDHQKKFYDKIIKPNFDKNEVDDLRRLFYVKQIHSFFVLLAFFAIESMEEKSKGFLLDILGIEDLESILFVLKEPKPKWNNDDGDVRFFNARGLVQEFLSELWEFSLAPIYKEETIKVDFNHDETQNRLYLFIKDKKQLQAFTKKYFEFNNEQPSNTYLFKALESTYISSLLEEVKVKVKKRVDGKVTFKELSEGEQQLLTVIGLIMFTREKESLILLDEPDTHLNPLWKYDYLYYLRTLAKSQTKLNEEGEVEEDRTTQIIINTHDPLVIGSLDKSQVKLFRRDEVTNQIIAESPSVSPKGLGVAGILTSELFGLPTILDKETQAKLNRKRFLQGKILREESLDQNEYLEYHTLKAELEKYGFYEEVEDQLFKMYLAEISKHELIQKVEFTKEEKVFLQVESKKAAERVLERLKNKTL
jgi:predicted ATPase